MGSLPPILSVSASANSSGGTGGAGRNPMAAWRGAAINGRLTPGDMSLIVPVLVDSESLSDKVTAVVQWAPAIRIVSREEKSLEDMILESLGSLEGEKLDIFMSKLSLKAVT